MKKPATDHRGLAAAQHSKPTRPVFVLGLAGLISLMACPSSSFAADPAYTFKLVTALGNAAPGGGAFANDFEPTALNNRGELVFTAEPDALGEEGLFLASSGTVQQIARFGQGAPGGGVFSAGVLGDAGLNDGGDVAIALMLEPFDFGPPINSGLYRWSHQTRTLSPVVIPNVTPAPGGGVFAGVNFNASLNNQGALVFNAYVANTPLGLDRGVFLQDNLGRITGVARTGDPSPDGGTFLRGALSMMNDAGDITFFGRTTQDPTPDYGHCYVRRFSTGTIEMIPQPAGVILAIPRGINNRGELVVGGTFTGAQPGIGSVYLSDAGGTTLVAAVGSSAPGGGNFSLIIGLYVTGNIALNNLGNVVFDAATDTGDEAVYVYSSSTKTLRRLAGIGTVIPGVGRIVSLEQGGELICCPPPPITGFPNSNVALNDLNQVAFAATVVDGTVTRGVLLLATPQSF